MNSTAKGFISRQTKKTLANKKEGNQPINTYVKGAMQAYSNIILCDDKLLLICRSRLKPLSVCANQLCENKLSTRQYLILH